MDARALAVAGLCVSISATAVAQRATGIVRDSASSGMLAGAVVSVLDSARHTVARAISNESGKYSVDLPAAAFQLRIVRLGFRPRELPLAGGGRPVQMDVRMTRVPLLLASRVVSDDRMCSTDVDRTGALSLWEQARAGLLAAVVAREAHPATATIMIYRRLVDDASGRVVHQTSDTITGHTKRPFQAADEPSLLAAFGYLDADSNGENVFRAPDADVLLDDTFAATHCFTVKAGDSTHAGLVGLGFEPTRERTRLVDVTGTLWLEGSAPALHSLDFTYTDPDDALKRVSAGGTLAFQSMPNGVTFIKDWVLSLPVIDSSSRAGTIREYRVGVFGQRRLPLQTSEAGGLVLRATWPDGSMWKTSLGPFSGAVVEQQSTTAMPDIRVMFEATPDTLVSDSAGHVRLFPMLPGRYRAVAVDTSLAAYIDARVTQQDVVQRAGGTSVVFELPSLTDLVKTICEGLKVPLASATLLGRIRDGQQHPIALPRNVSIAASWKGGARAVMLDAQGRFAVCGVPQGQDVKLIATRFGFDFAEITMNTRNESLLSAIDWTLDFEAMARLAGQKLATIKGRVTQPGGMPVAGAEIWLPTADRTATTDSSGAFLVENLPSGPVLVQVRSIGFAAARDKVLLNPGEVRVREYVLDHQATQLEGMGVTAKSLRGTSSGYRGFEARRSVAASGHYLSDSLLRKLDDRPLSSILLSRVSGVAPVPGRSGQTNLISTSRKCAGSANSCREANCYVAVYTDGHLVYPMSAAGGEPPPDINFFQVAALSGVEFYSGAGPTPPEFSSRGSQCGTLLLWSRER